MNNESVKYVTQNVKPLEPLYSMLIDMTVEALQSMHDDLNSQTDEAALDEMYQNVGITNRVMIGQVKLALNSKGIDTNDPEQLSIF